MNKIIQHTSIANLSALVYALDYMIVNRKQLETINPHNTMVIDVRDFNATSYKQGGELTHIHYDGSCGLCDNILLPLLNPKDIQPLFKSWDGYSGSCIFPVEGNGDQYTDDAIYMCLYRNPKRWSLIEHILATTKATITEHLDLNREVTQNIQKDTGYERI